MLDQIHSACDRFYDNAGYVRAVLLERLFYCLESVEVQHQRVLDELGGHAGRCGVAECQHARSGLDQQAVGMAVIAAFELNDLGAAGKPARSEEHTSELQSLMRISYAVFCLKKKNTKKTHPYKETKTHKDITITAKTK